MAEKMKKAVREDFQWSAVLPGESAVHTLVGQVAGLLYATLTFLGEKTKGRGARDTKTEDTTSKELVIFHWQKRSTPQKKI